MQVTYKIGKISLTLWKSIKISKIETISAGSGKKKLAKQEVCCLQLNSSIQALHIRTQWVREYVRSHGAHSLDILTLAFGGHESSSARLCRSRAHSTFHSFTIQLIAHNAAPLSIIQPSSSLKVRLTFCVNHKSLGSTSSHHKNLLINVIMQICAKILFSKPDFLTFFCGLISDRILLFLVNSSIISIPI